jgi:nicotinate phosphoribosyltransferase
MRALADLYRPGLALLTDLYQLTMAAGYWKLGRAEEEAAFHLFFRKPPFGSGFTVAAGLESVVDFLKGLRFSEDDTAYLGSLKGNNGKALFETEFLEYLRQMRFTCDVDAVPEGTVVFANEPLVRVKGPIVQAQIIETALLNLVNFQTLIATKAARVCLAAAGQPVLEFGLRRAQGIDGGLSASRAAYVGGVTATSNVLAGKLYGIPVRGTHAHSWVMSFGREDEAFEAYAKALPNNCTFLVDTYDTVKGVENAIRTGRRLAAGGFKLAGVRVDSGDLAGLSAKARAMLDEAGFKEAYVVGSNDLDEYVIQGLVEQGAGISVWGVGTALVTGGNQSALGGVYKLGAVRKAGTEVWRGCMKFSEEPGKSTFPGVLAVKRFELDGVFVGDVIYEEGEEVWRGVMDVSNPGVRTALPKGAVGRDMLVPVFRAGECVCGTPGLEEIRRRVKEGIAKLPKACLKLKGAQKYLVGVSEGLASKRNVIERENRRAGEQ